MAELDFVAYINATSTVSAAKKALFLDDFCRGLGYANTVTDAAGKTTPNPEGKTAFANRAILEWITAVVKARRFAIAYETVTVEPLEI